MRKFRDNADFRIFIFLEQALQHVKYPLTGDVLPYIGPFFDPGSKISLVATIETTNNHYP